MARRLVRPDPERQASDEPPDTQPAQPEETEQAAAESDAGSSEEEAAAAADPSAFTERLVQALQEVGDGCRSSDIARALGITVWPVRRELRELEALGMVYRTGSKRWTRWHLA